MEHELGVVGNAERNQVVNLFVFAEPEAIGLTRHENTSRGGRTPSTRKPLMILGFVLCLTPPVYFATTVVPKRKCKAAALAYTLPQRTAPPPVSFVSGCGLDSGLLRL